MWNVFKLTYDQTASIAFQLCHALIANFAVATVSRHTGHKNLLAVGVVGFAAAKEFWYDYKYEDAKTRGSSLLDFSMYCVGVALAYLV
jgi:hypothetical protein